MRRRQRGGYTDFGPTPWPVLPPQVVMVGDNGVQYFLTHSGQPGELELELSTSLPSAPDTTFYGPLAGPYIAPTVRLVIAGGQLSFEYVFSPTAILGNFNPVVYTRRGKDTVLLEIGFDFETEEITLAEVDVGPVT